MDKVLRGIDLVKKLKTLEEDYDIEVKSFICDSQQAEGYLAFQGVNFDYKYHKNILFLELNDMKTHFEYLPDMSTEELLGNQKYMQQELERLLEVPVVVNMVEENIKEEVLMNKDTALKVIQQGWGKGYTFQSEDEHGIYFESEHEEVKMVTDVYPETGVYSVYGRPKDAEDWDLWDDLDKEDVAWYLKEANEIEKERVLSEKNLKEKLEDLKMDIATLEGVEPSDEDLEEQIKALLSDKEDVLEQQALPTLHWYEMQHPIAPGAQPKGFVEWDEEKGKYGLVAYERPLTEQELKEFDMKEWQVEKEMTASEILDEARMIQENYGFSPYEVEWDNEVFQDYLKEIDPEEHKRFNDLKGQFEKQSKKEKIDETFMERE